MRIVGTIRDLTISCQNGEKEFYGQIVVSDLHSIVQLVYASINELPQQMGGFISIYAEQSKTLRLNVETVTKSDQQHQFIIDRYAELRSLVTMEMDRTKKLYFSVMLPTTDFNYFAGFIEANFMTDVRYAMNIPFRGFPKNVHAQEIEATSNEPTFLPLELEFVSGMPCLFPNAKTDFIFMHPPKEE